MRRRNGSRTGPGLPLSAAPAALAARRALMFGCLCACLVPGLAAQTEEDLFSEAAPLVSVPEERDSNPGAELLERSDGVEIGLRLKLGWDADLNGGELSPSGGSGLGISLDARPEEGLRLYSRFRYAVGDMELGGELRLEELFADLSLGSAGRVRVGKQAASWGLGYWWSPADILSLKPIDEADPEALREGTLAVKYGLPIGLGALTLYAALDGAEALDEAAFAGRLDLVLAGGEYGFGLYWRPDEASAPRAVATGSFDLGSLDAYAEAVLSLGSELRRVDFSGGSPAVSSSEELLFSGAFGLSYANADAEGRWDIEAAAEYYFNGTGIEDSGSYARRRDELLALAAGGLLSPTELYGYGRHYGALLARLEDLGGSGFGLSLALRSNLHEASAWYQARGVYEPLADFRLEAGLEGNAGARGAEYSPRGAEAYLSATLRVFEKAELSLAWPIKGEEAEPRAGFVLAAEF